MTVEELADTLLEDALAAGSTSLIDEMMKAARAALKSGGGMISALTNSSANGKSFQRAVALNPAEVLRACRSALARYAGDGIDADEVSSTVADFRDLQR